MNEKESGDLEKDPQKVVNDLIQEKIEERLEEKEAFEEARIREIFEEEKKDLIKSRAWEDQKLKQLELINTSINAVIKAGFLALALYVLINFRYVLSLFGY